MSVACLGADGNTCLLCMHNQLVLKSNLIYSGTDFHQWEYYLNTELLKADGPNYLLNNTDFNSTQNVRIPIEHFEGGCTL